MNDVLRRAAKRFSSGYRAIMAAVLLFGASNAFADTLAQWTFETTIPTTGGPISPEVGSGSATGVHAGAAVYTSPVGNGSIHSWSSNTWAVGDSFQFQTSTLGFNGIQLSVDHVSSNTGPRDWKVQYSTDGSIFTDAPGAVYIVRGNNSLQGTSNGQTYNVVPADYNNNAIVDAADYTVWRDHLGEADTSTAPILLPRNGGISPGTVDARDYLFWTTQFGSTHQSSNTALADGRTTDGGAPYFWDQPQPNATASNPNAVPTGGSTRQTIDNYTFDLSSITDLNNLAAIYLRVVDASTNAADPRGDLPATVAGTGTSRIENVTITGSPAVGSAAGVPEPTSVVLALIGALALAAIRRRK